MIQISGSSFQQNGMVSTDSIDSSIIRHMNENPTVYSYQSTDELLFELQLRKNIILSAKAMNASKVKFAGFRNSRCNLQYWQLTRAGGFLLEHDVKPSDAIRDIYLNGSNYACECATAMMIIYYHAVLNLIGNSLFNQLFQDIYLYSWHADSNLELRAYSTYDFIPGDVVYFENPDFDPRTPQWRGENAVVLEDNTYFGHGVAIKTAEQMIQILNKKREPEGSQSAYLTNIVARPSFKRLFEIARARQDYSVPKYRQLVDHHNEDSISFARSMF